MDIACIVGNLISQCAEFFVPLSLSSLGAEFVGLHSPEFRSHQSKTTDSVDAAYSLCSHEVIVHEGAGSKRRMVVLPESQFSVDATSMYNPNAVI